MKRWLRTDNPPLAVLYAVFWLTTWGRQHVYHEAEMLAQMHASMCECLGRENEQLRRQIEDTERIGDEYLRRENEMLRRRIEYLERVGRFGSANDPLMMTELNTGEDVLQAIDFA